MAVTYSITGENPIVIGGQSTLTPPQVGVVGPFPRYSISREVLRKDSLYIGDKYNISITGTALIVDSSSMLVVGDRQNDIHAIIGRILSTDVKKGTLDISPYGGLANVIKFTDAILVSCDTPEQDDTSQGVQSQDYTFTFEATELTVGGIVAPDNDVDSLPLDDVTESWDISADDSYTQNTYEGTNQVFKDFTISHTISATGRTKIVGTILKSGYIQAKAWVDARIDTLGNNPLLPAGMTDLSRGTAQVVDLKIPTGYVAYNQTNVYSQDILAGTYSLTRTWKASKYLAGVTIDLSVNNDQSTESVGIDLSVSVQGYDTSVVTAANSLKYKNALSFWDGIKGNASSWATSFYTAQGFTGALKTVANSTSEQHNQTAGSISASFTFDDGVVDFTGAISQSVNITYVNEDGGNQIVAILPVIEKSNGPIIQDMKTTQERSRSITLDLGMDKTARTTKPNGLSFIETNYKPTLAAGSVYRQSKTESWNPNSGAYNLSVDYVWTASAPTN
tara:strand:+ start:1209 stop:2726 length:1518 start_codon:yes stop_codon:yes gene_type:complete